MRGWRPDPRCVLAPYLHNRRERKAAGVRAIKVQLANGVKAHFHADPSLKKGDAVVVATGFYQAEVGTVLRTWSLWRGYTYPVVKPWTPE